MPPSSDELITVKRSLRRQSYPTQAAMQPIHSLAGPRWWISHAKRYLVNIFIGYFLYNLNIFMSTKIFQRPIPQGFVTDDPPG
jgi:hypothetical protein